MQLDAQAILKKNYSFVPEADRLAVVDSCKYIESAILSIDKDRTVCETIKMICNMAKRGQNYYMPTHFANGGDVTSKSKCPEEPICKANKVCLVYGLCDKIQSSSWIIEDSVKKAYDELYGIEEEEMDEEDEEEEVKEKDINEYYNNVDIYSEDEKDR